jgi:uncharacterized protein (DUF486 family)
MPTPAVPVAVRAALLLVLSNVSMTYAWYGHLKTLAGGPWYVAALLSWGVALFEYLLRVPANRLGATALTLGQLKVLQEVITLAVFVPFAALYCASASRSTTCGLGSARWARRSSCSVGGSRRAGRLR